MKTRRDRAILCVIVLCMLVAVPSAQQASRSQRSVDPMTAAIRGRVITDSGTPVQGAEVRVSSTTCARRLATTDEEGRFVVRDLPAGEYRLQASRAGFTSIQFGQRRPFEAASVIELSEGQTFTANLLLPRAGAITGRVIDQYGEPLAGTRVQAFRSRTIDGRRRVQSVGPGDQTDDTGAFRVYGLPPGDYYVAASGGAVDSVRRDPPVFYPGTNNVADAQIIAIAAGAEVTADFQLGPVRNAQISGIVFSSTGAPIAAAVSLISEMVASGPTIDNAPGSAALRLSTDSGPNGAFAFGNVPPGPYTLTAQQLRRMGPGTISMAELMANMAEMVSMPIVVSGENISAISLVLQRASTLTGEVVAADDAIQRLPSGVRVSSRALHEGGISGMLGGATGQFTLLGLSGPFHLDVQGLPEGWMVRSISVDGVDVTDEPIDLKGKDGTARVELSDRVGTISGLVRRPADVPGASVLVFPEDRGKWASPWRFVRTARAGTDGRFRVSGLPANDRYLVAAVDFLEEGDERDIELLEQLRSRATNIALGEGEQRSVALDPITR